MQIDIHVIDSKFQGFFSVSKEVIQYIGIFTFPFNQNKISFKATFKFTNEMIGKAFSQCSSLYEILIIVNKEK